MNVQRPYPATPSPSATLILAREGEAGIEVYLLRRSAASKFMPGTYVFPGGNLEPEDMDVAFWQDHVDLPVEQLEQSLDGAVDRMLPFAVAAIRETWEEAGLLLAGPMKGFSGPEPVAEERHAVHPTDTGWWPWPVHLQAGAMASLDHAGTDAATFRHLFFCGACRAGSALPAGQP